MTSAEARVSIAHLRECFELCDSGALIWRARPEGHFQSNAGRKAAQRLEGKAAGTRRNHGYLMVELTCNGRVSSLMAHRVVWALTHGEWPAQVIDHINRDKADNRPSNLRDVSPDENMRNNGNGRGTGLLGAYRIRSSQRFMSRVILGKGKTKYLGVYDTAQEAHEAYVAAQRAHANQQEGSV